MDAKLISFFPSSPFFPNLFSLLLSFLLFYPFLPFLYLPLISFLFLPLANFSLLTLFCSPHFYPSKSFLQASPLLDLLASFLPPSSGSLSPDSSAMPPQLQSQNQSGPRILQGDLSALSPAVKEFLEASVSLCQPDSLHICDGSDEENRAILTQLEEQGMIKKLKKYENW